MCLTGLPRPYLLLIQPFQLRHGGSIHPPPQPWALTNKFVTPTPIRHLQGGVFLPLGYLLDLPTAIQTLVSSCLDVPLLGFTGPLLLL